MATPKGTHFVISGNFLASGAPAYRRGDGSWTPDLQQAHAAATEQERDELLAVSLREESRIADAYAFPVRLDAAVIDPMTAREQIRANGPSVAYDRAAGDGARRDDTTRNEVR